MINKNFLKKTILVVLAFIFVTINVHASSDIINKCSNALVDLKIMVGDEKGNLNLDKNITRCEFVTLVNRMMGYDEENLSINVPFSDIDKNHWAFNNVKAALNYGLIKGYTDNTLRPNNFVSFVEAQAVIVRALGYENSITEKWPEGVVKKSSELKINKNLDLNNDKQINRGEAAILIYNALTVNIKK